MHFRLILLLITIMQNSLIFRQRMPEHSLHFVNRNKQLKFEKFGLFVFRPRVCFENYIICMLMEIIWLIPKQ